MKKDRLAAQGLNGSIAQVLAGPRLGTELVKSTGVAVDCEIYRKLLGLLPWQPFHQKKTSLEVRM